MTLALQGQQGRSAQQGQQVPRDPLDLLGLGGLRDLLEVLEIHQPHPGASNPRGPYAPSRERARFSSEILARAVHQPLDLTLGEVGNPGGSPEATRRQVNKAFLQDMRKAWDKNGMKALEKCARNQPAAFCKMYVPREMKVEHSPGVASLTDEQLEAAIAAVREMIEAREKALDDGQLIKGKAEPVALPASGQGAQGEP